MVDIECKVNTMEWVLKNLPKVELESKMTRMEKWDVWIKQIDTFVVREYTGIDTRIKLRSDNVGSHST